MKLKTPELEIPSDAPFKNDLLGREESALALTELICSTDEPLVLSINASWGEGKTTFLNMWQQMLKNKGVKTVYFNAWENDFSEDAFVSLIAELKLGIEALSPNLPDESGELIKLAAGLMKRSFPTAVKLITAGIVDTNELAELSKKIAEEEVQRYEESKKSVTGFKQALTELAAKLYEAETSLPLVILIDELDRCRPTYAIKILEAVKHFFSVPNVVFVLAIDRKQLGYSIESAYGVGMDTSGYLRRFIDIDYNLPKPKKGAFCKEQFARFGLLEPLKIRSKSFGQYEKSNLEDTFSGLFCALDLSLREQERCFTLLSLAIRTTPDNHRIYDVLLAALLVINIKNNSLFQDFVAGKINYQEVVEYIGTTVAGKEFLTEYQGCLLEAYLACCNSNDYDFNQITQPYSQSVGENSSDERGMKIFRNLQGLRNENLFGALKQVARKIDLVSNFKD